MMLQPMMLRPIMNRWWSNQSLLTSQVKSKESLVSSKYKRKNQITVLSTEVIKVVYPYYRSTTQGSGLFPPPILLQAL